jgi:hypothetical protein
MRSFLLIICGSLFSVLAMADAGFSNGHSIGSILYRGQAHVVCNGYGTRYVLCDGLGYTPDSHDRFVHTEKVAANKVELVAQHEDGSDKSKSVKYDATKGRSEWVNLTVSTVLQRPLLEYGVNKISYAMKNGSQVVSRGSFDMELVHLGSKMCRTVTVFAHTYNECQDDNYICNQYFQQTSCN